MDFIHIIGHCSIKHILLASVLRKVVQARNLLSFYFCYKRNEKAPKDRYENPSVDCPCSLANVGAGTSPCPQLVQNVSLLTLSTSLTCCIARLVFF